MTKRKAKRLEDERMQHQRARILELERELRKLAIRTSPDADLATDKGRLDWACTFPCGHQEILQVPSLSALTLNDDITSISAAFKAQESQIMEDIRIFQMQTRRALVHLLRKVEAVVNGETVDQTGKFFPDLWDQPDVEILRNEDHAYLVALKKPTAVFTPHDLPPSCAAYPCAVIWDTPISAAVERMTRVQTVAAQLVKALGLERATMEHMSRLGKVFCCERCPADIPRLYTWISLVSRSAST